MPHFGAVLGTVVIASLCQQVPARQYVRWSITPNNAHSLASGIYTLSRITPKDLGGGPLCVPYYDFVNESATTAIKYHSTIDCNSQGSYINAEFYAADDPTCSGSRLQVLLRSLME